MSRNDLVASARERVSEICLALPDATAEGDQHLVFQVRKRSFAYFLDDHHGDGELAFVCKVEPGLNQLMADSNAEAFFIPAYVGHRGWVARRLDTIEVDWDEISDLALESYCLVAPKKLSNLALSRS